MSTLTWEERLATHAADVRTASMAAGRVGQGRQRDGFGRNNGQRRAGEDLGVGAGNPDGGAVVVWLWPVTGRRVLVRRGFRWLLAAASRWAWENSHLAEPTQRLWLAVPGVVR